LNAEFQRVRREGKSVRGEIITLGYLRLDPAGARARAGFVTSRRVGPAVKRNRVRRRLREIFRKHQSLMANDIWIVVIASARAAGVSFRSLEDEWLRLARAASILAP